MRLFAMFLFKNHLKNLINFTDIFHFGSDDIQKIEKTGSTNIVLEGSELTLTNEDVEISFEDIPGWLVASDNDVTVALDINITDQLREESF